MIDTISVFIDSLLASFGQPTSNIAASVAVYSLAGLASALFPCYYPLIPVTAGFLRRRSQYADNDAHFPKARKNDPLWLHPLVYWLGTVVLYLFFGLAAASGGQALSKMMQNGWVILLFGIVFLYLTLAMLDLVPLGFDKAQSLVSKAASRSGLSFTFLMGMAAGLAASACVSPALVTILLFIAQQSSTGGSVATGMVLAVAYGAGLGLPLFFAGVLGAKLPKSGKWMNPVKYMFAAIIYVAAFLQIEKALVVLGLGEDQSAIILYYFTGFSVLLLFGLPWLFRSKIKSASMNIIRFKRMQAVSVFALLALMTLPFLITQTKTHIAEDDALLDQFEQVGKVRFYRHPGQAFDEAKQSGKAVFIDFYADWCANCKDFSRMVETNNELADGLNHSIPLKIYDTDPAFDRFAEIYGELNVGLPFFLVLRHNQLLIFKTTNYRDTKGMLEAIDLQTKDADLSNSR